MNNLKNKKVAISIILSNLYFLLFPHVVYASNNVAEKGVKWLLEQAFWVVIGLGVIATLVLAAKRAYAGILGTLIATVLIAYLCKNPEVLGTLADGIGQSIFN